MDRLMSFLAVFGFANTIGNTSSGITTVTDHEADTVANKELEITEQDVVRRQRHTAYYDDDDYEPDEVWHQPLIARGLGKPGPCIPSRKRCGLDRSCCTYDCQWFFGSSPGIFTCAPGICAFSDGTYRPCRASEHQEYVVEYNYFSPNRPLYPPPGKPVTPW